MLYTSIENDKIKNEYAIKNNIPLYTLETKDSLDKFDILGFTLQYEMSYTNCLQILDLAHMPLLSKDRNAGYILKVLL